MVKWDLKTLPCTDWHARGELPRVSVGGFGSLLQRSCDVLRASINSIFGFFFVGFLLLVVVVAAAAVVVVFCLFFVLGFLFCFLFGCCCCLSVSRCL